MTKQEMLRFMRLLSAMESVMLAREKMPDYIFEDLTAMVEVLEREILK